MVGRGGEHGGRQFVAFKTKKGYQVVVGGIVFFFLSLCRWVSQENFRFWAFGRKILKSGKKHRIFCDLGGKCLKKGKPISDLEP